MTARWYTLPLPFETPQRIAADLGISETLATVLARRGYTDSEAARRFLYSDGELYDPFLFPQMGLVCDRIRQAAATGESVIVHGDYDVDGVTATALLTGVLRELGVAAGHFLPNRFADGYGVSPRAIERIAAAGATLLITVDCGITALESIRSARERGLDVIVIDHHRPAAEGLPDALIISPLVCDYPCRDLAGVGLAFKVAQALLAGGGAARDLPPALAAELDLVALGTVADVVPLTGENRSLVQRGLVQLARNRRPGLKALMEICQVDAQSLSASQIAFRLAPRINAAGRLDDPGIGLSLLLEEGMGAARELAGRLDSLNRERQKLENQILAEAQEMIGGWSESLRTANGFVFSSTGWHEGVIGIVASKLVEIHHRPVIMIAEGDSHGKGSGRSIAGFNLHGALTELQGHLHGFGGHSAACGLTIDPGRIAAFREAFAGYADAKISASQLDAARYVDSLVTGRELNLKLAEELALMEPFGMGNPPVRLLMTGAQIRGDRKTRDGQHLQCQIHSGGVSASAIGFRQAFMQEKLKSRPQWDVVFRLEPNEFNGSVSTRLNLCEFIPFQAGDGRFPGLCEDQCDYSCQHRVAGAELWELVEADPFRSHRFLEGMIERLEADGAVADTAGDLGERLVDRRGFGSIRDQIARLITSGEDILLLVADVPRRRRLLSHELPLIDLDLQQVLLAGSRCSHARIASRLEQIGGGSGTVMMADPLTAFGTPGIAEGLHAFRHIVFVDPPQRQSLLAAAAALSPDAWIHLFYCGDEVQFTGKVLEHEYDLRAPLAKVFGQLRAGNAHPLNETTERLLLAGGRYLRQPALVARCLRVLGELGLISVEESRSGPILSVVEVLRIPGNIRDTSPESPPERPTGKIDLDSSPTYRAAKVFYEGCLKYLSKSLNGKPISNPETAISRSSSRP